MHYPMFFKIMLYYNSEMLFIHRIPILILLCQYKISPIHAFYYMLICNNKRHNITIDR